MRRTTPTMGSVYQLPSGRWRASVSLGYDGRGKRVRKTGDAATRSAAIQKRNRFLTNATTNDPRTMTVEAWMTTWLAGDAKTRLRPNVHANAKSITRRHINPTLGAYQLADLGAEEVRELHDAAKAAGVSDRTIQIIHSTLSVAMKAARREGLIDLNPCERLDRPRATMQRRDSLTAFEARRVIVTSLEHEDPLATMWATALLLGGRSGELRGMEWPRIDLDMGLLDLSWQLQAIPWAHGKACGCVEGRRANLCPTRQHDVPPGFEAREVYGAMMLTRPKTSASVRLLPIPAPLVALLRAIRPDNPTGLIWTRPDGRPLDGKEVTAAWKRACQRAGVRPLVLHTTRHTTASLLMEAGVSPEVIRQILGHSDLVATRGYLHISQAMAADGLGKLADLLAIPAG